MPPTRRTIPCRGSRRREPHFLLRAKQGGFSLVEVALALLVIMIATLGSVSWSLTGMDLEVENREHAQAREVLRTALEEIQASPFEEIFARFNEDPQDDPDGLGTARGARFTLQAVADATRSLAGSLLDPLTEATAEREVAVDRSRRQPMAVCVEFPVDATGRLTESPPGAAAVDLAWDLDGDGSLATGDYSTSYQVLPVRVRIEWRSEGVLRSVEHVRLLTHRPRPGDGP